MDKIKSIYERLHANLEIVKSRLRRPLLFSEKVLYGHLFDPTHQNLTEPLAILDLFVDRIAMQDATAQMAILQFMLCTRESSAVATSIHCDHLITARYGLEKDEASALNENREVFDFLHSASSRYGIDFWPPGAGIIHQVVLENYALPGGLLVGSDSHTPNAGGVGMIGIGAGGGEIASLMVGERFQIPRPRITGIKLNGRLSRWASPKDVILKVTAQLTTTGGTGCVLEYFGAGAQTISASGKATITNMGAEVGATFSIFRIDDSIENYLRETGQIVAAENASKYRSYLSADEGSENYFESIIEIDLSSLKPKLAGPLSPDVELALEDVAARSESENWDLELSAALLGSCTNSSFEDMCRAADIATQALRKGLKAKIPLFISPGSSRTRDALEEAGYLQPLLEIGGTLLASACGPCAGQWQRNGEMGKNSVVASYNRNFRGRNDGNSETSTFLSSPELVVAFAISGRLDFNPLVDALTLPSGENFRFEAPSSYLPPITGFKSELRQTKANGHPIRFEIDSERLQVLERFPEPKQEQFVSVKVLAKVVGKCTTDQISPVGKWMRYRGHLDRISENFLLGAQIEGAPKLGVTPNGILPAAEARALKAAGQNWVIVADDNYGEGSSREHAAMTPRHLGCVAVIAKSFARIHESNLKRQGILPLLFTNAQDFDRLKTAAWLSLQGVTDLASNSLVQLQFENSDGEAEKVFLRHSLTLEQVEWFRAGSAINYLENKLKEKQ